MKIRVYYMAEILSSSVKDAEERVALEPNLLQYYETEVVPEEDEFDPLRIDLDMRKSFDLILELGKIDKKLFKDMDKTTINTIYENRITKGTIHTASAILSEFMFVFYFPYKDDAKVVKITPDIVESIVGKFIAEDMAKPKPYEENSLA